MTCWLPKKEYLAPTREEHDKSDNGVVPGGLDYIERAKVSLLRRRHWPQYIMSHCLENQESYNVTLKIIQEQYVSPEKQRDATKRFLLAQERGCPWSTEGDICPKHFVSKNTAIRDAPIYGCGCCGTKNLDTSLLDSQQGLHQY